MDNNKNRDNSDLLYQSRNYQELKLFLSDLENQTGFLIDPEIETRLLELERFTKHNRDARVISRAAGEAYHFLRKFNKYPLEPQDEQAIKLAAALHDVGKSGPFGLSLDKRELIIKLYGVENVSHELTAEGALKEFVVSGYLPLKQEVIKENLSLLGVSPQEKMAVFWHRHARWTHQILSHLLKGKDDFPGRVTRIASSHHYLENCNPAGVKLESYKDIGVSSFNNLDEKEKQERRDGFWTKLLIVLDQYQGARRRGGLKPQEALDHIGKKIIDSEFKDDVEFALILDEILPELEKNGIFWQENQQITDNI